ncbi:DUF4397 domain-containing protein [Pseudonocardia yuanmonensis]|uniref:DUF4397 domain-containing protein n=1 Tax=Pseudonocardia yuanmonensis TaxID=1095914 RepID=A0ABP8WSZ5_9PSEU
MLAACAATIAIAPAATAQETGSVHVVHGIPDTPVDVYVDGQRALDDFAPGTAAGPVDLPAGSRTVALFPADAADGSGQPLLSGRADVPAGGDVTLAAHLDAGGSPTLTPFVDDVSPVPAGQARLVVRHTAAAPAVDVLADGSPAPTGLTNPNQAAAEVPAGTLSAAVAAAGTTQPVLGPADLQLAEGTATFVHAVGSLSAGNLQLVTFTVEGLHSAPAGVPAGAPSGAPSGSDGWAPIGVAAGLAVVGLSAAALRRGSATRS